MAIYRYQSGTPLDYIQVLTNETGGKRAYLHADASTPSAQLRTIKLALRTEGMTCIPTVHDGQPMLEVRGFKKEEDLLKPLKSLNLINETPSISQDTNDKRNLAKKASSHPLRLAGLSYNVGDISYLYYRAAPLRNSWKTLNAAGRFSGIMEVIAGIGYGLGSIALTRYGAKDQSINAITTTTKKIEKFSRAQGYEVEPESTLSYVNNDSSHSIFKRADTWLSKYPSEALNLVYVMVGACITAGALYRGTRPISKGLTTELFNHEKKARRNELIDVGLGAVTATSAVLGLTVKEHKFVEGEKRHGGIGGFIDWIREKPLRATGYGYMIATAWHGVSTVQHWRDKTEPKKFLIGRAIFIATNVISEILLAVSSKGHGTGVKPDESVDKSVLAATAELILRQPEEKQAQVQQKLSRYLSSRNMLGVAEDTISTQLQTHMDAVKNNPWTKHYTARKLAPKETLAPVAAKEQTIKPGTHISSAVLMDKKQSQSLAATPALQIG